MLRAQMDQVGAMPDQHPEPEETLSVPQPLAMALSQSGLPKRSVTQLSDTPALAIELIAHATSTGAYVAIVGWPELVLAGVAESGGQLARVITIPDAGLDPYHVVAVLCEGMDLVVYRSAQTVALSPVRARPMLAKLRKGNAALVLVNATVASPAVTIDARVSGYRGIGHGTGRIRGIDIDVSLIQKGRGPAHLTLPIGAAPAAEASGKPDLRVV